jgi:hypothetical protein
MVHLHRLVSRNGEKENNAIETGLERTLTMTFPGLNKKSVRPRPREDPGFPLADLDRQLCLRCLSITANADKCMDFCANLSV